MMRISTFAWLLLTAALAGCAPEAASVPGRIASPSVWTMVPPQPLPDPQPNEDAKELLRQCRAAHGTETDKLPPLQSYVRIVTKKQKQ